MNEIIIPSIESNICYAKSIIIISEKFNHLLLRTEHSFVLHEVKRSIIEERKNILRITNFLERYNIKDTKMELWLSTVFQNEQGDETLISILERNNSLLLELFLCIIISCLHSNTCKIKTLKHLFKKVQEHLIDILVFY